MNEWREIPLRSVGQIVTGKTPPTSDNSSYGGDIPFVTPSDMDGRRTIDETTRTLTKQGAAKVRSSFIQQPSIVVSCIGSDMGKAALVDGLYVSNQQINSITTNDEFDRLFIYYNLSARKDEIRSKASGAAQPIMNKTDFGSLQINVPSLEIQRAIGNALGTLDEKIELNRRMNETLEALAQAIFKDWFVTFGPTRRKQEGATDPVAILGGLIPDPTKAAPLASFFPDSFSEDGLPEGWEAGPFSRQIEIIGGGTPKTSKPEYWEGNIPWFSVADTPKGSDTFVFKTEKSITREGLANSSARLVGPGTTIITARGTVGNLAVAGREMTFNQSCYALKASEGDAPYFTFLTTKRIVERLQSMAHGSVFSTITRQTFENVEATKPPLRVRDAFEDLSEALFSRIKVSVLENRTLAETRDYLLPKLMSGAVRVRETEKAGL